MVEATLKRSPLKTRKANEKQNYAKLLSMLHFVSNVLTRSGALIILCQYQKQYYMTPT